MVKMAIYRQTGFILLTVMIFLTLLTLLCLHMLQDSLMQTRMNNNIYDNTRLFTIMETALSEAEAFIEQHGTTTCALSEYDSKEQWIKYGKLLIIHGVQIRFASLLLQTVCYKQQEREYLIDFFRITVRSIDQIAAAPFLLQSTYARRSTKKGGDCLSQRPPSSGRQSWLQLSWRKFVPPII